jgi:hypothetical protein
MAVTFQCRTFSLKALFVMIALAAIITAFIATDYRAFLDAKACTELVGSLGGECGHEANRKDKRHRIARPHANNQGAEFVWCWRHQRFSCRTGATQPA